ncbi:MULTISPECIES: hypothetical protein [Neobacillus]|uniref:Uncharacterized protein n=1 Tax=Neobacillus citreus TaxID=2833578 RepID=A0A942Y8L3_9BACI|nr:hypothetical protein [Neobacillus citreus]MCH6265893.1 hypothetical protein [Neobacillus citreus]
MIWLYIFLPVIVLGGIAVYFDKKSGMTPPDEGEKAGKIKEYPPEHGMNSYYPPDPPNS